MKTSRPSDSELAGMTLNERLFACRCMKEWDTSVRDRDRERMISVLMKVGLTRDGAGFTVDAVLKDPVKFGFSR